MLSTDHKSKKRQMHFIQISSCVQIEAINTLQFLFEFCEEDLTKSFH
jgi:hypothetical protein